MIAILSKLFWAIATSFLIIGSLYFTWRLKFLQFRFKKIFGSLFTKKKERTGINPIDTLMLTLAGRIGVGSIAGIALAISIGGKGTLFWIWIMAILVASLGYSETVLAIVYRKKDNDVFLGGPSYYMRDGLGWKKTGAVYAILIIVSYIGGFLGVQANTITKSLNSIISVSPYWIGFCLVVITASVIFGGIKRIASFTSKIVPLMSILYLGLVFFVLGKNIGMFPNIIKEIFQEAFQLSAFTSSFIPTMIIGIQRGIFSNEAGLGTGSITAATSSTSSPSSQGYLQILGIYITSLLLCSATAFFVLTSNYQSFLVNDLNGVELVSYAFKFHFGGAGPYLLFFFILLFSFSTILTGYYDGETSLKYFFKSPKKIFLLGLKVVTLIMIFAGCIVSSTTLWNFVDLLVAWLAIINICALVSLRKNILLEFKIN